MLVRQALEHPFLAALHDPEWEPSHSEPFVTPDIDDEALDWSTVRRMIYDEAGVWSIRNGRRSPLLTRAEQSHHAPRTQAKKLQTSLGDACMPGVRGCEQGDAAGT